MEPSLSTSTLLLWWMFLLGEAFLCTSFSPTALPLLLLPGLTEIWEILDTTGQPVTHLQTRRKHCRRPTHSFSSSWSSSRSMSSSGWLGRTPVRHSGQVWAQGGGGGGGGG